MHSQSIHGCFAAQAAQTPHAIAVSASGTRLTYRELDSRANQLAHRLLDLGVRPETPVAVLMDRSVHLVVALLAVLKAGGCYLPLHSAYPLERMQWIVDRTASPVLLVDDAMAARKLPRSGAVVHVDTDTEPPVSGPDVVGGPDDLAYVMYTSGSTGEPKGVAVTHRGVLGLVADSCWDGGRHERVLMVAPHAFSVSAYETWVPLLRGGQIVMAPPGVPSVSELRRLIVEHAITGLHLTAGLFRVVADEAPDTFRGVREVLTGGDVITPKAVRRVLEACPDTVVRAMYGATETTLFTTTSPMTAPYEAGATVPVGRPMDGVAAYVLDDQLNRVPAGGTGELYIAGSRLARGYLGRADLTAERFVADPFSTTGERMYRTGDVVRQTPDGLIDFLRRADDLVKIRGFRVELGEVESVLANHPDVADVAVLAKRAEPGDTRLVAYVVPAGEDVDLGALRGHAMEFLPEFMVPSVYVPLTALPLTPNGKLDRGAMPEPDFANVSTYRAPRDATQEILCSVFADVLGVPRVGIDDSFFDLGGQSLTATRLISRIRSVLGAELSVEVVFNAPTVASLTRHIGSMKGQVG